MAEAVDEKRGRIDGKVTVSRCMGFRINPTMEQKTLIWKTFGCCRFVWNHLLDERISYERIAKEQRKLSRMQYGSANYWEQKHRIGKLHENARNRRKDFLHKLSRKVSDAFDAVVVEDINLRHMSQSLNFGKSVYDNGYGMLRNMLSYKLKDKGKVLIKVDRFFPSSKRCSACHEVNHDLKLSDREWTCRNCGTHHDRDKNSCKNLLDEGKDILNRWTNGDSSLILAPSGVLSEKKLHPQTHSNVRQGGE